MKLGKNQILLPSGVIASKDGKYHYWNCTVTGLQTFAKPEYWVKVMAKFGTEENLVATYVCKKAKQYLAAGYTSEQIKALVKDNELPSLNEPAVVVVKKVEKAVESVDVVATVLPVESVAFVMLEPKERVTYAWSNDPNYFKSTGNGDVDIETATLDTCMYPNMNLDALCRGCRIYDRCKLPSKYTEKDWNSGKKKFVPTVTHLVMDIDGIK